MSSEDSEMRERLKAYDILGNVREGMALGKFHGFHLPVALPVHWLDVYNFDFQHEDIVIYSFPKSGSHWVYYIAALLRTRNFGELPRHQQRPIIEVPYWRDQVSELETILPPRMVATHLPGPLLPKHTFKAKVIYVYRDPRDVVLSNYHHYTHQVAWPYNKPFEDFVELFMRGKTHWGPYHSHLQEVLKLREEGRPMMFIAYEDLQTDLKSGIRRIANFLEEKADEELVEKISVAVKADNMKANSSANGSVWQKPGYWKDNTSIVRKARSGGWKEEFQDKKETWEKFEKYMKNNIPSEFLDRKL